MTWNNKLIYIVHLVGYFHSCINDARIDDHETDVVLQEVVKQKGTFTANLDNSRIALKTVRANLLSSQEVEGYVY